MLTWLLIQPDPKGVKKVFNVLQSQFAYLSPRSNPKARRGPAKVNTGGEDFVGEYQNVLDQDFFDFVLYEVPWITF